MFCNILRGALWCVLDLDRVPKADPHATVAGLDSVSPIRCWWSLSAARESRRNLKSVYLKQE
jgi:hypothetical protein